jgi:hypothetical protein
MTKENFLELSTEQITEEIISDVYESSLNTGIDYVDEVYTNNDEKIFVNYYYDGDPCTEIFASVEEFRFHVKTYGI